MTPSQDIQKLAPQINILIDGKLVPLNETEDLQEAQVLEDLEAPSMFTLEVINWDIVHHKFTWVDDDLFNIGNKVEIQMGYGKKLKTLIVGEITGLEPEFSSETGSKLVVRGHDLRHRLLRGQKTRSFTQKTDSEIASAIAQDLGLKCEAENSKVKLDYVLQHNQTDLEFLQERAKRIGYEVVIVNKTLYFRSCQNKAPKVLSLKFKEDLLEFYPRLSTMNQVAKVEIRAWDIQQKQALIGRFIAENQTALMGNTSGAKTTIQEFGRTSHIIVNQPISNKAEADQIAQGQFNEISLAYITGEGTCLGNPDLQAGKVIEIAEVGRRFSGLYYVTSATHTYTKKQGYRTKFTVRRNAV